jgi:hypothetical protein
LRKELLAQALTFWAASQIIQDQANACTVLAYSSDLLKAMLQRIEAKDYRDIAVMIDGGVALDLF